MYLWLASHVLREGVARFESAGATIQNISIQCSHIQSSVPVWCSIINLLFIDGIASSNNTSQCVSEKDTAVDQVFTPERRLLLAAFSYQAQLDVELYLDLDPFKSSAQSPGCVTIQLQSEHSTYNSTHCTAIHLDGAELSQKVDCKVIKTFYWLIKWRQTWKSSYGSPRWQYVKPFYSRMAT